MKLRLKTFETNSSSTHSLAILNDDFSTKDYLISNYMYASGSKLIKGMTYYLETIEAGWGTQVYFGVLNKLQYYYTELLTEHSQYDVHHDGDNAYLDKYLASIDVFQDLLKVLSKRYKVTFELQGGTHSVDHQSSNLITDHFKNDLDKLLDFITNDKYVIMIDNDNCITLYNHDEEDFYSDDDYSYDEKRTMAMQAAGWTEL